MKPKQFSGQCDALLEGTFSKNPNSDNLELSCFRFVSRDSFDTPLPVTRSAALGATRPE